MKKVIVSVTNDLHTDNRVDRTCNTLLSQGFEVCLVGRLLANSSPLNRPYSTKRFALWWTTGALFYASYNLRLFIFLLFSKADLFLANDLDTLPANFLAAKLRRKPLIYDTHEYFTHVPELIHRPTIQRIWRAIEQFIFPKLTHIITVNHSIASLYQKEYGKPLIVIRNIPEQHIKTIPKTKEELGLPLDKKIVILQGAGINIDRGAEEAVEAFQYLDNAILLLIGQGDVIATLKDKVKMLQIEKNVLFLPRMPKEELYQYTLQASVGLTLDKDTNLNYRYSLPNKLFDYIHAGTPILASPLIEVQRIIEQYRIGKLIEQHDPVHIADRLKEMLSDEQELQRYKENLIFAQQELSWEKEETILINLLKLYKN